MHISNQDANGVPLVCIFTIGAYCVHVDNQDAKWGVASFINLFIIKMRKRSLLYVFLFKQDANRVPLAYVLHSQDAHEEPLLCILTIGGVGGLFNAFFIIKMQMVLLAFLQSSCQRRGGLVSIDHNRDADEEPPMCIFFTVVIINMQMRSL